MSGAATQLQGFSSTESNFILRCMYIPRPAKLLFTIDEGWNKFIENSATTSAHGPAYRWSACSPVAPVLWASDATAVHPRPIPTAVFSARAANQKPAAPAGLKPLSSGLPNSNTFFPTVIGNISPLPYPIGSGPSSTIIGHCSMRYYERPRARCFAGHASKG